MTTGSLMTGCRFGLSKASPSDGGKPVARFARGTRRGPWTGMGFALLKARGEPFQGFRTRTSTDLKVNFFWLLHYVTQNAIRQNHLATLQRTHRVWFDDIVV